MTRDAPREAGTFAMHSGFLFAMCESTEQSVFIHAPVQYSLGISETTGTLKRKIPQVLGF